MHELNPLGVLVSVINSNLFLFSYLYKWGACSSPCSTDCSTYVQRVVQHCSTMFNTCSTSLKVQYDIVLHSKKIMLSKFRFV